MNYTKSGKAQRIRDLTQDIADVDAQVGVINEKLVKFASDKAELEAELARVEALEVPEDAAQGASVRVEL